MKLKIFFSALICFITINFAQNDLKDLPEFPEESLPKLQKLGQILKDLSAVKGYNKKASGQDLIVGQTDPNEILQINSDYLLDGNLFIINNGKVVLNNADFKINGDIRILNDGLFSAKNSSIEILQSYIYEHNCGVYNNGKLLLDSVSFSGSGESWGLSVTDNAYYEISNSSVSDGYITTSLNESASALITNTSIPGEFLCFSTNNLQFVNCNTMLLWLVLNSECNVDISLPEGDFIDSWNFENNGSDISGIPYSVSIDFCENVMWGLISNSNSNAIFRDSELRVAGLIFTTPDSIDVNNITNGKSFTDETINLTEGSLRLINTSVETWNLYPASSSKITIENCIVGEVLSYENSSVRFFNSICDGSGGYFGVEDSASVLLYRSLISSQLVTKSSSTLISAGSAINSSKLVTDDNSVMAILNTTTSVRPAAFGASAILEEQLPFVEGKTNNNIEIKGTAQIITGPESPVKFAGYKINYSSSIDDPVLFPVDEIHTAPKENETLGVWNTSGLTEGNYLLNLVMYHNLGDSIVLNSNARLDQMTTDFDSGEEKNIEFSLSQNYPNPFNLSTTIKYCIPDGVETLYATSLQLKIYDILGREVITLVNEEKEAGNYAVQWNGNNSNGQIAGSGVYIYQLNYNGNIVSKRMSLLK